MTTMTPQTTIDARYSSPDTPARSWIEADAQLDQAQMFWLSTVRPDGAPHVTPLMAVWVEGALYFCTGESERKAMNLAHNPKCILTTGCNTFDGLDVVVEGVARAVTEEAKMLLVAMRYASKYGWKYEVRDGAFHREGAVALLFEVAPLTVFGFAKSEPFSQTRWRF